MAKFKQAAADKGMGFPDEMPGGNALGAALVQDFRALHRHWPSHAMRYAWAIARKAGFAADRLVTAEECTLESAAEDVRRADYDDSIPIVGPDELRAHALYPGCSRRLVVFRDEAGALVVIVTVYVGHLEIRVRCGVEGSQARFGDIRELYYDDRGIAAVGMVVGAYRNGWPILSRVDLKTAAPEVKANLQRLFNGEQLSLPIAA